jgi:hypothetical protein
MREGQDNPILSGFLLLRARGVDIYRGLDREPFDLVLIEEELEHGAIPKGDVPIWKFYPPGWRRDAYRVLEENAVPEWGRQLSLVSSYGAAVQVLKIIGPHIDPYEIVWCTVYDLCASPRDWERSNWIRLGFDVAYPGGDHYSAIRNGLFHNPHPGLVLDYEKHLNRFGLFEESEIARRYLDSFREVVASEADSSFFLFGLSAEPPK